MAVFVAAALLALLVCGGGLQAVRNRRAEGFVADFLASVAGGSGGHRSLIAPGFDGPVAELRRRMTPERRALGCRSLFLPFSRSFECVVHFGNGSFAYLDVAEDRGERQVTALRVAPAEPPP